MSPTRSFDIRVALKELRKRQLFPGFENVKNPRRGYYIDQRTITGTVRVRPERRLAPLTTHRNESSDD